MAENNNGRPSERITKRIVPFFMTDGRHPAVSRDDLGVIRQHQQFAADIVNQIGMIAAREIGAGLCFRKTATSPATSSPACAQ